MSLLKKLIPRTSVLTRLTVRSKVAAPKQPLRLLSSMAVGTNKSLILKKPVMASQPINKLATAAGAPPAPPAPPAEEAMFNPAWLYRGFVFPQLRGIFDKNFEKNNGVQWHQWGPFPDIDICWVYNSNSGFNPAQAGLPQGNAGPSCALMRFKPNSRVPPHWHTGCEHIIYLSGSQTDERGVWRAGDLVVNPAGTDHWQAVTGPEGCVVLTIWERSALPLNPAGAPKSK